MTAIYSSLVISGPVVASYMIRSGKMQSKTIILQNMDNKFDTIVLKWFMNTKLVLVKIRKYASPHHHCQGSSSKWSNSIGIDAKEIMEGTLGILGIPTIVSALKIEAPGARGH